MSKAKSPVAVEVPVPVIVNWFAVERAPVKVPVLPEKEEPVMVAPEMAGLVRVPLVVILVAVLETAVPAE